MKKILVIDSGDEEALTTVSFREQQVHIQRLGVAAMPSVRDT